MSRHGRRVASAMVIAGLANGSVLLLDGAPPAIRWVEPLASRVGQYERIEISISLDTAAGRVYYPYGDVDDGYAHPEGITVDARITEPDRSVVVVPAFYYVPYERTPVGSTAEALGITGPGEWRVRFTPRTVGAHTAVIVARDAAGEATSPAMSFSVDRSDRRGFIRVSRADPRFLIYDNGDDFIPIAEGRQWAPDRARVTLWYEEAFERDAANGVTLTRVWDQNDSYNLSIEGAHPVWLPTWSQFTDALGVELAAARTGRRAARFRRTGDARSEGYVQWVAVQPSTTYTLSGWIRTEGLSGGGAFLSADARSHLEPGRIRSAGVKGTRDWTQVSTTFTTGRTERTALIWIGAERSRGTAWFDDVALTPARGVFNVLSDGGFERHFPRADAGNDPEDPRVTPSVPKGTEINQWAAFQLDRILDAAERHGIAVQLCAHGDVHWTWDATVRRETYAKANGYVVGWMDPRHLGYWKRALRYRIARWGHSPAVLAWELWNEHGHIDVPSDLHTFYQTIGRFVADLDSFGHLFTTSQGSQAYSPQFWADTPTGVVNYHDYMTTGLARDSQIVTEDAAAFVYSLAGDLVRGWPARAPRKPVVWGEIGTLVTWNVDDPTATGGAGGTISRHNFLWAGPFSPVFTSPIDWQHVEKSATTRALARFFAAEAYAKSGWRTYATTDLAGAADGSIEATPAAIRVLAIVNATSTRLLGWLQHRDHTWAKVARDGRQPVPVVATFTTPALEPGSYRIEWWDTRTGALAASREVEHAGESLGLTTPGPMATDVAVKVYRVSPPPL